SICPDPYIGETSKALKERISQHRAGYRNCNPNSLLVQHALDKDHPPDWDNTTILHKNITAKGARLFLEAWHSTLEPNSLNRHIEFPSIYTDLLHLK
ncbi:GIY-YIG nuclease family protein, partial [Wolbachia endosymbiont of Atemnus politus]|uniref:hypothetical protein n=1 Tax=Wolbachia endosymbiont of Atemnus politus TaxID=2682840 RepID=UPI001C54FF23